MFSSRKMTLYFVVAFVSAAPILYLFATVILNRNVSFSNWQDIYLVILFTICLPFLSEVLFRKILLRKINNHPHILKFRYNEVIANTIVSLIYALLFLIYFKHSLALFAFYPSLVYGFMFLKTNSILPSVALHIFHNVCLLFYISF